MGYPKLGLPSNYEGKGTWKYYRLLTIKSVVFIDVLFVIVSMPLVDKSQALTVYKIHNVSILIPELCKHFQCNIPNDFRAIPTNGLYITYPDSNEILSCQLSAVHYCEINTLFYPINNTHHCSYYLLQNNDDEKVKTVLLTIGDKPNQRPNSQLRLLLLSYYLHETF